MVKDKNRYDASMRLFWADPVEGWKQAILKHRRTIKRLKMLVRNFGLKEGEEVIKNGKPKKDTIRPSRNKGNKGGSI